MKLFDRNINYLRSIILFLVFVFCRNNCSAQNEQVFFDHITTRDGLSQSTINHIIQDKNGFLWFATYNGLNKYDGYSFKVYNKNNNALTSISSNDIYSLFEDNEGFLWIINNSTGIDRFDPKTETFVNFCHDPTDNESISSNAIKHVTQDNKGNIWICADDALNLYVPADENENKGARFIKYRYQNSTEAISRAYEDSRGQLLLFSNYLYYFDRVLKTIVNTGVKLEEKLEVSSVIEDNQGNLLLGTILQGVIKLKYNQTSMAYQRAEPGKINVTPNRRSRLMLDHNKNIWIGTEEGLFKYTTETDILEHFVPDDSDNSTISDKTIHSIYEDKTGVLWIGTFSEGLNKYDFYHKQFLHFKKIPNKPNSLGSNVVSSIHSLHPNELWVGSDAGGGVNRILFSSDKEPLFIHYLNDPENSNSIGGNSILCLVQRKNGDVWVGSGGGTISRIRPEPPFSGEKPLIKRYYFDLWTFSIFEDSDGVLWGGTWEMGLWRYNDQTNKFDFFASDHTNKYSICDNIIWSIGEDQHKNIWIGGHGNGISVLTADEKRKQSPKFIHIGLDKNNPESLSNNTINAFLQAKDGTFWVATAGGLNKVINYDKITGEFANFPEITFRSYNTIDGLASESILGIVEDNNNFIWLSTRYGISKMNPQTEEFVNYNEYHGLQSNEFWHNAYFKNSNGMIFFGGENGFNAFYPENIKPNPFLPKVVITELLLFNNIVNVGDTINKQVVLNEPIYRTKEIALSHKNNIITFQFAALHFAKPSLNKYAYYLEGFENDWNYVGNQRTATYTNLDPGNYTFKVKATNNDGLWSDNEVALGITIKPPWWKSLFIKILSPFVVILFTLGIFRIRLRLLKQQKKVLQKTVGRRTEELQALNALLVERQEEILIQNEELLKHRHNLEELVEERTFELKTATQKAEESDRLKSSFLSNMSHEIRTPMNAILGFLSLLKNDEFSEKEKDEFIRVIDSNGETLMVLINDILDISMIESNQLTLHPQYFNVNSVLKELEDYYRLKDENELTIQFTTSREKELILYIDPIRFRQIMNNLLSNALKFTSKGFIRFGYYMGENEICFFVSDSGVGIDSKHSENIFEHFYKIERQTNKIYRGTGIGLAICKSLVELLEGKIWLESKPGSGSTFSFTIPYNALSKNQVEEKLKIELNQHLSLDNIFYVIAEDEPINYELLIKMLQITNERHFWGKNGKEVVDFIRKVENQNSIIVLMDIKMPEMDGYDALKLIKSINKKIPVIAVTAFALKHEEKEILDKGFDDYLSKPIIASKLKEIIGKQFNNQGEY